MNDPPKYDQGEPPSYESLFGKLKQAKVDSDSNVGFAKVACGIIFASVGCTICLVLLLALPVANIVIGALYLDDCPLERLIPIYLIVMGVFAIIQDVFGILKKISNRNQTEEEDNQRPSPITSVFSCLVGCFIFAWFICGNVWVYSNHGALSSNTTSPDYCHPTLYYYAFWVTTGSYILIGTTCFFMICCGCIVACCAGKEQ